MSKKRHRNRPDHRLYKQPIVVRHVIGSDIFDDLILLARGEILLNELPEETRKFVQIIHEELDKHTDFDIRISNERRASYERLTELLKAKSPDWTVPRPEEDPDEEDTEPTDELTGDNKPKLSLVVNK